MRKNWQPLLALFCLLLLLITGVYAHVTQLFTVRQITCQVSQDVCPDYVVAELESYKGKSIFFTDFYQIGQQITEYAPFLQSFQIKKKLPQEVQIEFIPSVEKYILQEKAGLLWVVDEAGYIISQAASQSGLPVINQQQTFLPPMQLRGRINSSLHSNLIELIENIDRDSLKGSRVNLVSENEVELTLPESRTAILNLNEVLISLEKLRFLLNSFDFQELKEPITIIDLRYQHIVLRHSL